MCLGRLRAVPSLATALLSTHSLVLLHGDAVVPCTRRAQLEQHCGFCGTQEEPKGTISHYGTVVLLCSQDRVLVSVQPVLPGVNEWLLIAVEQ